MLIVSRKFHEKAIMRLLGIVIVTVLVTPPPIGARANHYARCLYSKG